MKSKQSQAHFIIEKLFLFMQSLLPLLVTCPNEDYSQTTEILHLECQVKFNLSFLPL